MPPVTLSSFENTRGHFVRRSELFMCVAVAHRYTNASQTSSGQSLSSYKGNGLINKMHRTPPLNLQNQPIRAECFSDVILTQSFLYVLWNTTETHRHTHRLPEHFLSVGNTQRREKKLENKTQKCHLSFKQ